MRSHWSLFVGVAMLMVAGFNAFHHVRSHLEDDNVTLPLELIFTTLVGVAVTLAGAIQSIPEFKSSKGVKSLNAMKRDELLDRPTFRKYYHRARDLRIRAGMLQ